MTTMPRGATAQDSISHLRESMRASFEEARARVSRRVAPAEVEEASALHADLKTSETLAIQDCHALEQYLSHVRHGVVRACLYNLNVLCPSLEDEYDPQLRDEFLSNVAQLKTVREELDAFFRQALSSGETIEQRFGPECTAVRETLTKLQYMLPCTGEALADEQARKRAASEGPVLIKALMDSLQHLQAVLDQRKVAVSEVLGEAVHLCEKQAANRGVTLSIDGEAVPGIYADRQRLLNAFIEVVTNSIAYSGGDEIAVYYRPIRDRRAVEVTIRDNGRGMTAEQLNACTRRGVSFHGGTGEGLPMVLHTIEAEHLGNVDIASEQGAGCAITVHLPVKYDLKAP